MSLGTISQGMYERQDWTIGICRSSRSLLPESASRQSFELSSSMHLMIHIWVCLPTLFSSRALEQSPAHRLPIGRFNSPCGSPSDNAQRVGFLIYSYSTPL